MKDKNSHILHEKDCECALGNESVYRCPFTCPRSTCSTQWQAEHK